MTVKLLLIGLLSGAALCAQTQTPLRQLRAQGPGVSQVACINSAGVKEWCAATIVSVAGVDTLGMAPMPIPHLVTDQTPVLGGSVYTVIQANGQPVMTAITYIAVNGVLLTGTADSTGAADYTISTTNPAQFTLAVPLASTDRIRAGYLYLGN